MREVDNSQSVFCRDEVTDDHEPCRFLVIRNASCVEDGPQAFLIGLWNLANNSHFITPFRMSVHLSDGLVYPYPKLVPGLFGMRGRYIGHVQCIMA